PLIPLSVAFIITQFTTLQIKRPDYRGKLPITPKKTKNKRKGAKITQRKKTPVSVIPECFYRL
ncbi:MAG TPA: hypothetical protein PK233_08180, partial [Candidatus Atribacteria bacterium]|nr:hypothetical protein [Candidatus Atribacteria bacterium]HQD33822.1 hypothetical protein [Candidatus Atribacteria bacterium]